VNAAEAIATLLPGATIAVGGSNAEPRQLVEELRAQSERLAPTTALVWPGGFASGLADPALAGRIDLRLSVPNRSTRAALRSGQAAYVPGSLHALLRRLAAGEPRLDAAVVMVAPPDADGWCSLGTSAVNMKVACDVAPHIVAEVNDQMPRTGGGCAIHRSQITCAVDVSYALPDVSPAATTEDDQRMSRAVAELVPDGATIQCGIGATPDAVLTALRQRHDLAIWSGIIGDGIVDLAEAGALRALSTGTHAPIVTGSVLGSRRLYEFVHENPLVEVHSGLVTHDPFRLAQLERLVSIQSALEIDLSGQVNAEEAAGELVAGSGGMLDFARGAQLAPGGINILVLRSTAGNGRASRIVPQLAPGAPVTMPRADVTWVVTEHGAVNLEGLTLGERRDALLSIADPAHREALSSGRAPEPQEVGA